MYHGHYSVYHGHYIANTQACMKHSSKQNFFFNNEKRDVGLELDLIHVYATYNSNSKIYNYIT